MEALYPIDPHSLLTSYRAAMLPATLSNDLRLLQNVLPLLILRHRGVRERSSSKQGVGAMHGGWRAEEVRELSDILAF